MSGENSLLSTPEDVLSYWFGNTINGSLDAIQSRMQIWFFRSSPEFDGIQQASIALINQLAEDPTSLGWNIDTDPKALMALIVVLDQFSRSVFRGTGRAFSSDETCANLIVQHALSKRSTYESNYSCTEEREFSTTWFVNEYSPIERFFLCVALQHSEQLQHQETGIRIAKLVGFNSDESISHYFRNLKGFPMEHYEVIRRFGRFPHRNILLGRETTEEEQAWLESDECPGWAKSQQPKTK